MPPVIDVHTHMLNNEWLKLLEKHGRPRYTLKAVTGGLRAIHLDGAPFMTPVPEMFDWDLRIKNMDRVGIDVSVVSLTCPNAYWGSEAVSLKAAQVMNEEMAKARKTWPDRIQWLCSLPWQYEKAALAELKRSLKAGACGVMVLANIAGRSLTDPLFAPVWAEIDRRALPVLVHPTDLPGIDEMDMKKYDLSWSVGFMADTTLAFARMIFDGFLDLYPNMKMIASHGGGTLPYLVGRFDMGDKVEIPSRRKMKAKPSEYLKRIWYDCINYHPGALQFMISVVGADRVLYGTDYPHQVHDMKGSFDNTAALPADVCRAVREGNARKVFRI